MTHAADIDCPTCGAWRGWACKGPDYGYHAAGYHPARHSTAAVAAAHTIKIECEQPRHDGALVTNGGHRARCSCGWWSDCFAQMTDTQRAVEVHLRKASRVDFETLIERSSIGAAIADVKERGIDAHLADLERKMNSPSRRK